MAGYIADFFGYRAEDKSRIALDQAAAKKCPVLGTACTKLLGRDGEISGACAIRQVSAGSPDIICCPIRLYADEYRVLSIVAERAFGMELPLYAGRTAVEGAKRKGGAIAVFGRGWGGELPLPQRSGVGSYSVDWVLARLDEKGKLAELSAIEVQTIDTTGNYRGSRAALLEGREMVKSTVGMNWENVAKRILPQIIYKGQVLQRESLCRSGLYFVCPQPVFDRVIMRLGGKANLPEFPSDQPGTVHFFSYDYDLAAAPVDGEMRPLVFREEYCTAVHKIQEAFSNITLPESDIYKAAVERALSEETHYAITPM